MGMGSAQLKTGAPTHWLPHVNVYQDVFGLAASRGQVLAVGQFLRSLG